MKSSQEAADRALKQLLADCAKSDDATVRGDYARYVELSVVASWLKIGGGKKK